MLRQNIQHRDRRDSEQQWSVSRCRWSRSRDDSDGLAASTATTTADFQTPTSTTGGGLVAASTDDSNTAVTDDGSQGSTTNFVANGGTTVATPALGVRRADIPLPARALIQALHYLPV